MTFHSLSINVIKILEFIALLIAIYMYMELRKREYLLLIIVLTAVVVIENYKLLILIDTNKYHNGFLNAITITEWITYFGIYYNLLKNKKRKRSVLLIFLIYITSVIVTISTGESYIDNFFNYSFFIGSLGVLTSIYLFIYEKIKTLKIEDSLRNDFWIWISLGLFIFVATDAPAMIFHQYYIKSDKVLTSWTHITLKHLATIVYYSTYPLTLIWLKKQK